MRSKELLLFPKQYTNSADKSLRQETVIFSFCASVIKLMSKAAETSQRRICRSVHSETFQNIRSETLKIILDRTLKILDNIIYHIRHITKTISKKRSRRISRTAPAYLLSDFHEFPQTYNFRQILKKGSVQIFRGGGEAAGFRLIS